MHTIESIRILPNSKNVFPDETEFKSFVQKTMIKRGGYYYFPGLMMNCPVDTLVLFQYDGMIRAYGILVEKHKGDVVNEIGSSFAGYYRFDPNSLHYLDVPIDSEMMRAIYPGFRFFSQCKQELPLECLPDLTGLLHIE